MADTYAVVQKRGAPAGAGTGTGTRSVEEAPLYSQVTPRAQRSGAHTEDAQGTLPGSGESRPARGGGRRRPLVPSRGTLLLWSTGPWRAQGTPAASPATPRR
ncbi:Tyrosine-protein phosphatase non-receptor type 18 [Plecturocebus cupreus]